MSEYWEVICPICGNDIKGCKARSSMEAPIVCGNCQSSLAIDADLAWDTCVQVVHIDLEQRVIREVASYLADAGQEGIYSFIGLIDAIKVAFAKDALVKAANKGNTGKAESK